MHVIAPSPRRLSSAPRTQLPLASSSPNVHSDSERFILLNLCGKKYQIDCFRVIQGNRMSLLTKFVLGNADERRALADFYFEENKSYYFWRNPSLFEFILQYHITGILHCPQSVCSALFLDELKFWEVNDLDAIADCCRSKVSQLPTANDPLSDTAMANGKIATMFPKRVMEEEDDADFSSLICNESRKILWRILERPASSLVAKIFTVFSAGLIIISVVALILGSMRQFQRQNREPVPALVYTEYTCVVWFTLEFFARLLVAPDRLAFAKDVLNIVDALSIFPFHVEFVMMATGRSITEDLKNVKGALLAMRVLRVLRVARVFKLARYSAGLQSFLRTFASSHKELGMLMMFFSSSVLLFSTTVYFMEKDAENSPFVSIPATFWWAIVTMTTVGLVRITLCQFWKMAWSTVYCNASCITPSCITAFVYNPTPF